MSVVIVLDSQLNIRWANNAAQKQFPLFASPEEKLHLSKYGWSSDFVEDVSSALFQGAQKSPLSKKSYALDENQDFQWKAQVIPLETGDLSKAIFALEMRRYANTSHGDTSSPRIVSHSLRNSLNSIHLSLELISRFTSQGDSRLSTLCTQIRKATGRMLETINAYFDPLDG